MSVWQGYVKGLDHTGDEYESPGLRNLTYTLTAFLKNVFSGER